MKRTHRAARFCSRRSVVASVPCALRARPALAAPSLRSPPRRPRARPGTMTQVFGGTKSTFGDQAASRRRSAPSYGFGSGTRQMQEKVFGASAQGPGTYAATNGVGPQVASTKPSTPRFGGAAISSRASRVSVCPYWRRRHAGRRAIL